MRYSLPGLIFILFLSGCFETHFNIQTVVHSDGALNREIHIDGRGANRFLPPEGPQWKVKTFETKEGQSIFDLKRYHIHAKGKFGNSDLLTNDFQYDTSSLIENVTTSRQLELSDVLKIEAPLSEHIGSQAEVSLKKKSSLWETNYNYQESLKLKSLILIVAHDLKKELRQQRLKFVSSVNEDWLEKEVATKLKTEILPQFQFHVEVRMPGEIESTNATRTQGQTAIWDFSGADFEGGYTHYDMRVVSKKSHMGLL